MKKKILVVLVVLSTFLFAGCAYSPNSSNSNYEDRISQLESEIEELEIRINDLETTMEDVYSRVWNIEDYLTYGY